MPPLSPENRTRPLTARARVENGWLKLLEPIDVPVGTIMFVTITGITMPARQKKKVKVKKKERKK